MDRVPDSRVSACNDKPVNQSGRCVLYWMIAHRRVRWNFSLQRAVEWCGTLGKPLLILEALRCGYQWSSDRVHKFIMDGMKDNCIQSDAKGVFYYPYIELTPGEGKGLLVALGAQASVVVTDHYPCFFLPRMVASAARQLPVRLERVDSNGILPMEVEDRIFASAHTFRLFLHRNLLPHLLTLPEPDPLCAGHLPALRALPADIVQRWPSSRNMIMEPRGDMLCALPIDHSVRPVEQRGGAQAAEQLLTHFLRHKLPEYAKSRNHPDIDCTSKLSPYLHFGHISAHQIAHELSISENWSPERVVLGQPGKRAGWWGMSEPAEAFLDELITWRELGYNMCRHNVGYDQFSSLPTWGQATLAKHATDPRPYLYAPDELEAGRTHDSIWNAAQNQLIREGRIHNYMRMLWGKKILEWTRTPQEALATMIDLNNKYALDGRDPNSYSGIFWILGRYDRAWGPERKVFGTVRYMSSANAARKLKLTEYVEKYAEQVP
jgi:deoxyribodipyrimidine photo-lyase